MKTSRWFRVGSIPEGDDQITRHPRQSVS
jgi:hypothetical protein